MIINHRYKFIFIKTRKTAGTSTEIALSQFCDSHDVITPIGKADEAMRQEFGYRGPQNFEFEGVYQNNECLSSFHQPEKDEVKQFYNHVPVQFVREHVSDRIWNTYFKFCFERNPFDRAISLYYFRTKDLAALPDITDLLRSLPDETLSNWWIYTIENQLAVDFVGRYENLYDDLEKVRKRLGIPSKILLPKAKAHFRKDRRHYSKVLTPESRLLIESVCSKEMNCFGYAWENILDKSDVVERFP